MQVLNDYAAAQTRRCTVFRPESLALGTTVRLMQHSHALVGQHGAGLVNGMFLPNGALVVEVRPYGFDPDENFVWRGAGGLTVHAAKRKTTRRGGGQAELLLLALHGRGPVLLLDPHALESGFWRQPVGAARHISYGNTLVMATH